MQGFSQQWTEVRHSLTISIRHYQAFARASLIFTPSGKRCKNFHVANEAGTARLCHSPDSHPLGSYGAKILIHQTASPQVGSFNSCAPSCRKLHVAGSAYWSPGCNALKRSKAQPVTLEVGTGAQNGALFQKADALQRKKWGRATCFLPLTSTGTSWAQRLLQRQGRGQFAGRGEGILGNPIQSSKYLKAQFFPTRAIEASNQQDSFDAV